MNNSFKLLGVALALLTFTAVAGASQLQAQETQERSANHVMSITKFKVPAGEMQSFLEMTRRANEIHEQAGSVAEVRVWVDNLAGPETGTVIHAKEYPSFEAMAADYALVHGMPEWQEFLKHFNASGVEVISNSLQWELIP